MQISRESIPTKHGLLVAIKLMGKITLGEGTEAFRNAALDVLRAETKPVGIILNFSDINYIDSSGLGELADFYHTIFNQPVHVAVTNLSENIDERLRITKLWTVFPIFATQEEAIENFKNNGWFKRPKEVHPFPHI
ncbi:MAG: STAS domain-containing protein [Minisyncoccia bacterium]